MGIKAEIFVNTKFIKFNKNFPQNFIFLICEKFKKLCENSENYSFFEGKIFSFNKNEALFYKGVEKEIDEKYNQKLEDIKNFIAEEIKTEFWLEAHLVKTKIPGDKDKSGKRLLSSVVVVRNNFNRKEFKEIVQKNKEILHFFFFPLEYNDFHKK